MLAMADSRALQILGVAMQNDAPATQVGKLLLQDVDHHLRRARVIDHFGGIEVEEVEVVDDFFSHGTLFLSGRGNLSSHVGDIGHRFADAHQRLIRFHHPRYAFLCLTMASVHGLHGG